MRGSLFFCPAPHCDPFFRPELLYWTYYRGVTDMVIYGDVLFVMNLLLDYGLLLATAKIAACPFVRMRLLLGACLGAVYALLIFVPGMQWLDRWPVRGGVGVAMALIAYGGERRFFHLLLVFFTVTAALGGGVLALTNVGGATLYRGVVSTGADLTAVLLAGSGGCALLAFLFRRAAPGRGRRRCVEVQIALGDKSACFRALVDTGNSLTDRANRQVVIADWQVLARILPAGTALSETEVRCPSLGFQKLAAVLEPGRVRLLSYRTVGVSDGLLLALRPDSVTVDGRHRPGALVAASAHPVSDGGEYEGLVGLEEMGGIA